MGVALCLVQMIANSDYHFEQLKQTSVMVKKLVKSIRVGRFYSEKATKQTLSKVTLLKAKTS